MDLTRWWCFGGEISQELGEQKTTFTSFSISTIWRGQVCPAGNCSLEGLGDWTPKRRTAPTPSTPRPGPPHPRTQHVSLTSNQLWSARLSLFWWPYLGRYIATLKSRKGVKEGSVAFSVCSRFRWLTVRVSSASWPNARIRWYISHLRSDTFTWLAPIPFSKYLWGNPINP